MQITLEIPNDLAISLLSTGQDPSRIALELLAVEGYRIQCLTEHQVLVMLRYHTRMEVHALFAKHNVPLHYTLEHLQQDISASDLPESISRPLDQPKTE